MDEAPPMLAEHDDHWILPFQGLTVTQVRVDSAFELVLDGKGNVRIESTATLGRAEADVSEQVVLDPEHQHVAAGLVLFDTVVMMAVAATSGSLRLVFSGGHVLRVEPDPHYEAWTASAPGGLLVVSLPGGGLSVWSDHS
ncbi:uncharacterized protein (AIM24 family) [Allocatelliglobosispora scoriae]|uniref:Uncharacterized protein (AIM24 family) n=1 Tax=Allocatelliglobosispora scoriae TaxID=643052 RepID=A0A841BCW3_9ACTN|nr:DUF6188 family protein [Allocatelliglobosispora scoriae]MBB5866947.1 uncharacterized protein (AIM24 family) [Allocatelliglobosispora scoriae]